MDRFICQLDSKIEGNAVCDSATRIAFSTDASAYRQVPVGVAFPKTRADVIAIVEWCGAHGVTLIPRAAGTSLAGQVVGDGLVVDVSRYMNNILHINAEERWVDVEPGVVLDELNMELKPYGLFFAPETSTSNRCCIGGMLGNNSCGSHSVRYGSTREHVIRAEVVLSDGSVAEFGDMSREQVMDKARKDDLEGRIYKYVLDTLGNEHTRTLIVEQSPESQLTRRNNGYALDMMAYNEVFDDASDKPFNLCQLLAGSEGTLALATKIRLNIEPLPPAHTAVMCMHCRQLGESFYANLIALRHKPVAVELMDDNILRLSEKNIAQRANRFFIEGTPAAILIIELAEHTEEELNNKLSAIEADMRASNYGYAYPVLRGGDISRVWNLRKAGLGLLSNMVGSAKPVSVIEDTAVVPERLPAFMEDIAAMLKDLGLDCVYHAHIATGELHLRPVLNLKEDGDRIKFREVATRTAHIVKKHRGSLSGEHGDGRLRGEFIPIMFGEDVYAIFKELKSVFDVSHVFNKGKIVDTPPMDEWLRYERKPELDAMKTYFDYSSQYNFINAVEQCNGAGDCRKSIKFQGVLCPAFKATGSETDTTRARANLMRTALYNMGQKAFDDKDVIEAMKNCLSCKACKSECPSSVDMTKLKAEFMQHHYEHSGTPIRTRLVAAMPHLYAMAQLAPWAYNIIATNPISADIIKAAMGFAPQRNLPKVAQQSLKAWMKRQAPTQYQHSVYLFVDEFTNHLDVSVGKAFVRLLWQLGYNVLVPKHVESGRTALSKGMVKRARRYAEKNVELLYPIVTSEIPLVGLEPSTLLSFRDEYKELVRGDLKDKAHSLANNVLLYDEFIMREVAAGNILTDSFTQESCHIILHGHCHQKSLASVVPSQKMLQLPHNYTCEVIPSGCCGMAGSYGYEKRNYDNSIKIAEDVLLPAVRSAQINTLIAAPGTSCREQIGGNTDRVALHPVEILLAALK